MIQTGCVVDALQARFPERQFVVQTVKTLGDRDQGTPLSQFGGTGVFVKELDQLLLAGQVDVAVHSLKDVPPDETPGLVLAAFPERADPRDVLVSRDGSGFEQLPARSRVGTSSVRRQAQLRAARPELDYRDDIRGNVETRLRKLQQGEYDAIVLAAAGLVRLGRASEISEYLSVDLCLPDAGQGTLAVSVRDSDREIVAMVARIDDPRVRATALAERAVLAAFGGGCLVPVAAYAETDGAEIDLAGLVATPSGSKVIRARSRGPIDQPVELGRALWARLVDAGAMKILAEVARD